MQKPLILASGSRTRQTMLQNAGVQFTSEAAKVDEDAIKASLSAEGAKSRDVADTLAEYKARRVAQRSPEAIVLGSDQVLDFKGELLSKPTSPDDLRQQLWAMRGTDHKLISAAVIYEDGQPAWRAVTETKIFMRSYSEAYLAGYIDRNWNEVRYCVGGYQIEGEGARLFARVIGDYFTVLGLPLIDVLGYLSLKGLIDG